MRHDLPPPVPVGPNGTHYDQRQVGFPAHPSGYQNYNHGYGFEPEEDSVIDPVKLLWFVVHYRWLIAATLLIGILVGVVFTYLQTPLYKASAEIEIQTQSARVLQDLDVVAQSDDWRVFETTKLKLSSRDLAERVVFQLDLANQPEFLAPAPSFALSNLLRRITGASASQDISEYSPEERADIAIGTVLGGLSPELVRNTSILSVAYSHPVPKYSAIVANQVIESFIDQSVDQRSETSDLARQFIQEQVQETKEKLQTSEAALLEYAQANDITVTGDDSSLISSNISEINTALSTAIQERLEAERELRLANTGNATALPQVSSSESIQSARQRIAELRAEYQEKLTTLKPGFPEMVRLQRQISELRRQVNQEIVAITEGVKIKFDQAKQKEAALRQELASLETAQQAFQEKNVQYTILKRDVDSNRSQYEALIGKLNEVGVGSEIRNSNMAVVSRAQTPGVPFSPNLKRNLALALALAAMAAAALIYLIELLNNTFQVPDQVEKELGLSIFGIIPAIEQEELATQLNDPKSGLSEAHRSLRTSLQFAGTDSNAVKTIMVTSAEPSEGKTTIAYKLAQDFAQIGRSVLVIDADMRKPRMHQVFGTDNGIGLSNILTNVVYEQSAGSIFRPTQNPQITLLTAGTIPPNAADLLVSPRMGGLLQLCRKNFDLVIVDVPPVMGLSDAPILGRQTDATLMVVAAKQSTKKSIKSAVGRLRAVGTNVVGVAFNKFSVNKLDYNYAYRYMQTNYYAYEAEGKTLEKHGRNKANQESSSGALANVSDRVSRFVRGSS